MAAESARQHYGKDWTHWRDEDQAFTRDRVACILLQEVRDELKRLNALLHCSNFLRVPHHLREIAADTTAKRQARARQAKARAARQARRD